MSGLLSAGDVRIALLNDDGSFAGFMDIKNTVKLGITPGEGEEINRVSKQRANYGQVLDSVVIPGIPAVALTFDEGDAETIGMALLGTVETLTLSTVTRTDIDLAVPALGIWLDLGDKFINPTGFEITNSAGTTTYIKDVDYLIDYPMGLVKFLADGDVTAPSTVKRSYTTVAKAGKRVSGGKKTSLLMRIYMLGKNLVDGKANVINIAQARMRSAGEFDPLTGEYTVTELTGTIIGDYTVDLLDTAA